MKTKLFIVTDLGHLRAYRKTLGINQQPHLELMDELELDEARTKRSALVSDQAGRFPQGIGSSTLHGAGSASERLHVEQEHERRLIRQLANKIDALVSDPEVILCHLAVSEAIRNQLLEAIHPEARGKIHHVLTADLTGIPTESLLEHFELAECK